jgi:nitroreductase/FMN reductase [NAD(P)H]
LLEKILAARFGAMEEIAPEANQSATLARMADHRSIRRYTDKPVGENLLRALAAVALSAPSKSDLQQADIVIIADPAKRAALAALLPDNPWVGAAPGFAVFCGNNRRQRRVAALRGHDFANDHLDAFFNAAVDAGIVLSAFITAAEAIGLGTCPISAIRNHADAVAELLALPQHVFPVAGLCIGWPDEAGTISPRLGLASTVHVDTHDDGNLDAQIAEYDARRNAAKPYATRRRDDLFGAAQPYGWSEDKARQYAQPERKGWGRFVRAKGFTLE